MTEIAISFEEYEKIENAIAELHGMTFAVMVANDAHDVFADALGAVHTQSGRVRDMFAHAARPGEER